jgi:hypothetical protein
MESPESPESPVDEPTEAPEPVLVVVDEDLLLWARGWPKYRSTVLVWAIKMEQPFVVDTPDGRLVGKIGDYLCNLDVMDVEGVSESVFQPVPAEVWESTYERME